MPVPALESPTSITAVLRRLTADPGRPRLTWYAADLVVCTDPAAHPRTASLVAVSLPALSRRFDGALPAGAIDAATSVMTYPDRLGWVPATDGALPALVSPGLSISQEAILELALERGHGWSDRPRFLIDLGRTTRSLTCL